jgi:ketosteroid isomerase-like protein
MPRGSLREAMQWRSSTPPASDDLAANVAWLRDRTLIGDLYNRYAFGVDSADMALVRSVFSDDAVVIGTVAQGGIDAYLKVIGEGLLAYHATMHFKGNQYIELAGDTAFVETWVVGYHMEAPGSPLQHLELGLRYRDKVARHGNDWKIVHREAVLQWHKGPFPRPALGEAPMVRRSAPDNAASEA